MLNKKLPMGYRMEYGEIYPGTGMGDEIYGTILYRWETRNAKRLWKKWTTTGWFIVGKFRFEVEAVRWARDTDKMQRENRTA